MEPEVMERVEELLGELEKAINGEDKDVEMAEEEKEKIIEGMTDEEKATYDVMADEEKEEFMKARKAENDEEKKKTAQEEEDKKKAQEDDKENEVDKQEDATTASDSAEDIIDELPEVTTENITEVAKLFKQLKVNKAKQKAKKQKESSNKIYKAIASLTNLVKGLAANQNSIEKAFENFMDAQGIKAEVMAEVETQKREKVEKSTTGNQAEMIGRGVAEALRQLNTETQLPFQQNDKEIKKSIGDDPKGFLSGFKNFFPK